MTNERTKRLAARIDRAAGAAAVPGRRDWIRGWTVRTNKQYLDELAATDPQLLQKWFDAPHDGDIASHADSGQLELDIDYWLDSWTGASVPVREIKQAVGQWLDKQAAITKVECNSLTQSLVTVHDSLLIEYGELKAQVDKLHATIEERNGMYENQVRILGEECNAKDGEIAKLREQVDRLKAGNDFKDSCMDARGFAFETLKSEYDRLMCERDSLAHDLSESERFREELREQLSVAYDHAHDLLAMRDRGLA